MAHSDHHVMDSAPIVIGCKNSSPNGKNGKRTPSPKTDKYYIKVNVHSPTADDHLIESKVDIKALRRYSRHAKAVLPIESTTKEASSGKASGKDVKYTMPHTGYSQPSDEAVKWLLGWFEENKHAPLLPRLSAPVIPGNDLVFKIDVLLTALALEIPFATYHLENEIRNQIRGAPISVDVLKALWEKTSTSDHPLVTAAVQSLTHFYLKKAISEEENAKLEAYFLKDVDLSGLFDRELKRQREMKREWMERKKRERAEKVKEGKAEGAWAVNETAVA
jgi:hypothetical protein